MDAENRVEWFRAYEQTYVQRDVRQLSQVGDLLAFRKLLRLAALRTGQILNQSGLGCDAQLNAVTTGRYLSLLETSCLLHRLPAYSGMEVVPLGERLWAVPIPLLLS